jgi:hypothetical protein
MRKQQPEAVSSEIFSDSCCAIPHFKVRCDIGGGGGAAMTHHGDAAPCPRTENGNN